MVERANGRESDAAGTAELAFEAQTRMQQQVRNWNGNAVPPAFTAFAKLACLPNLLFPTLKFGLENSNNQLMLGKEPIPLS